MMKKIVITVAVVVVFIAYSWIFRHHDSQLVLKPRAVTTQQSSQTATGQQSSPGSGSASTATQTASSSTQSQSTSKYKDGTYVGSITDAFYGNVQVEITISGGTITDVRFLQAPSDNPNSVNINSQAKPLLEQETIKAQSSNVDIISGATDTSQAFIQSLSNALSQAS